MVLCGYGSSFRTNGIMVSALKNISFSSHGGSSRSSWGQESSVRKAYESISSPIHVKDAIDSSGSEAVVDTQVLSMEYFHKLGEVKGIEDFFFLV